MQSFVEEESSNSVKVYWLKYDKLIEEIKRIAEKVGRENENVVKVILFGSLAEGRALPGSDADILVLLKKDERSLMERIGEWLEKFSLDFPVEVFPYTLDELDNPVAQEAIRRGIVLFKR